MTTLPEETRKKKEELFYTAVHKFEDKNSREKKKLHKNTPTHTSLFPIFHLWFSIHSC